MAVNNAEKFLEYLREELADSDDSELLSDVLMQAFKLYERWETDFALDELSDKGLIQMVLREDGKLAYEATHAGTEVNELLKFNERSVEHDNVELMGIEYPRDTYKVTDVGDSIKFVDHGDNFEIVVIPAGRQHNGDEFVQFYHTIFTHYNDPGPNGEYELVDEVQLYDILNKNYNQY